jgi:hypothetical protein
MRSITKLLLLCIFFTASFACRKEKCVIVDKHTYISEKPAGKYTVNFGLFCYYYERDKSNKYYKKPIIEILYAATGKTEYENNAAIKFIEGGELFFRNNTTSILKIKYKLNKASGTIEAYPKESTKVIVDSIPNEPLLQILNVEYL